MEATSGSINDFTSVTGFPVVGFGLSILMMRPSILLENPTLPALDGLMSLLNSYKLDILSLNIPIPILGKMFVVAAGDRILVLGLSNLGEDNPPILVSEDILTLAT